MGRRPLSSEIERREVWNGFMRLAVAEPRNH
jgi:hypothetical protein